MKAVGYCRVSTDKQAEQGVSLDAQREKVEGYARLHDLELAETVIDAGASAKSLDRPGLSRVLAMLESGEAKGLVIFKLDRLTRSLGDWSMLIDRYFDEKGGCSLMSVSESIDTRTAAGRMVLNMLMCVAQWERETIVERTRSAVSHKKARRERVSGIIPYGSALSPDGRSLVDDPAELQVRAEAETLRAAGLSLRAIAAELDRRGLKTKLGREWTFSSVQKLLKRPA